MASFGNAEKALRDELERVREDDKDGLVEMLLKEKESMESMMSVLTTEWENERSTLETHQILLEQKHAENVSGLVERFQEENDGLRCELKKMTLDRDKLSKGVQVQSSSLRKINNMNRDKEASSADCGQIISDG